MTNQEKLSRIKLWQQSVNVHPLTCGNNSKHSLLEPVERDGEVILVCKDCEYTQSKIPAAVFKISEEFLTKSPFDYFDSKFN